MGGKKKGGGGRGDRGGDVEKGVAGGDERGLIEEMAPSMVDTAPDVAVIGTGVGVDPSVKSVVYNPRYEEMWGSIAGPIEAKRGGGTIVTGVKNVHTGERVFVIEKRDVLRDIARIDGGGRVVAGRGRTGMGFA